ncbi:ABC transporter substrate-binding protein [Bradyrhizobium sp. IC3195]|uniref:ABC transporter substrate-binding protein n=1 Tax=Bradyrhizobium sp. IC3195 TaxID=2793804 RepID=UPI00201C7DE9|nr:ABC transporter substrate-binding protein [Bradyrhizobium sp. IC3195]
MQATSVIPIVFAVAGDPVANKLVASLAKPGGNVTGLSTVATDLAGKRLADPLVNTHRDRIQTLAMGARLPTIYNAREHVEAGGLMSYGPNFMDLYRRAAEYVDRILRGAKPANLPVEQPAKFDFVVNLRTAKALGLALLPSMLARADEVIE